MASILRSSKFVRYIAGFAKNVVVSTPREFDASILNHTQCYCGAIPRALATQVQASSSSQYDQNLEKSLKRIDQDVRKSGRISRRDIEDVLEDIRNARSATSSQSLLVIRCCGNLVPEELPEIRTKLVQEIWNTLNSLNITMDVSHYNALLRVYLENEFEFSPAEFLSDLEAKGIEPNRVTYQRLIARYCQTGDIEGATKILEYMREKQLPVNENVFNALIVGHSQSGDMESAYGIISVMTQAGLEPSADTYTTLLCGYSKKGDMESINKTLQECEEKDIFLLDKDYLDIIYALATNGHSEHVPFFLGKVRKAIGYNQDAINLILRLVNKGLDETAFTILQSMVRGTRSDGTPSSTGGFFLKQLVRANYPIEKILSYAQKLESEGMFERCLAYATESSLQFGNEKLAFELLEEVRKSGGEIKQHQFLPLLNTKKTDKEIVDILNKMAHYNIIPSNETLRSQVIPKLKGKSTDILATLRDANISIGSSASSLVVSLLQRNEIEEAAVIATSVSAYYSPDLMRRPLTNSFYKSDDLQSYINILRSVYDNLDRVSKTQDSEFGETHVDKPEILGTFILDLTVNKKKFIENIEGVLEALVDQGLSISTSAAEKIQEKLGEKMTDTISSLLGKLSSGELTPIPIEKKNPSYTPSHQMNTSQLERLIANLEAKGQETKGLKRQLLTLYYRAKDLEKMESLLETLKKENFVLTTGIYAQVLDVYSHHDKLDQAMECYKKVQELEGDGFLLDEMKIVKLANCCVKAEKLDEAIKILETAPRDSKPEERSFNYSSMCWRMLNGLAETGRVDDLNLVFDTLVKKEFVEVNNVILGPLIKVYLVNKDVKKALEKFEWCVQQFKATPWKNELACQLIQSEDAESLQKLTDLSTSVHGEINSLYDLVFAFVECGRIRQARKILETPGLQNRPGRINTACERYRQEGLVKPLEGLKDATKDLNHIDRTDIYYQLLLSYIKQDEPEKALGLWTQMQEEDLAPNDQFLRKLGNYLSEKGVNVPFVVPADHKLEKPEIKRQGPVKNIQPSIKPGLQIFRQKIKDGDVDGAVALTKNVNERFSVTDMSTLIEKLVQADRLQDATKVAYDLIKRGNLPVNRVFRFLLNKLAGAGDLDSLNLIGSKINVETKKLVSFDNRICHANLVAGKAEEYLGKLEKDIENAKDDQINLLSEQFPRGGAYGILERHPELTEKYEIVAIKYAQKGIVAPLNVLWTNLFILGNTEKAEQIWNDHLKNAPRIMFQRIVQAARDTQDENLTKKLIEHLKISNVTDGAIGNAYSCMLDVLYNKKMDEQLCEAFEQAIKDVALDTLNRTAIFRVKEVYEKLGKPFNHKIPPKVNSKQPVSSTSSSSSSEEKKKN